MGLREQAALDAQAIIENLADFSSELTLITPAGVAHALKGLGSDIGLSVDLDTGQTVTGRRVHVAFSMLTLDALGLQLPVGIADGKLKPWRVVRTDALGKPQTFKVAETRPDREVGLLVCFLEAWRA
jgi:hypothetical protein